MPLLISSITRAGLSRYHSSEPFITVNCWRLPIWFRTSALMYSRTVAFKSNLHWPTRTTSATTRYVNIRYNMLSRGLGAIAGGFASGSVLDSTLCTYVSTYKYFSKPEPLQANVLPYILGSRVYLYVLFACLYLSIWVSWTDRLWRPLTSQPSPRTARRLLWN